jgi:HlyD family secretion protein
MVQPGQALVKLYDRLQLAATVQESMASRLAVGEPLMVWVEALGKRCEGRVSEIVPEADPLSRSFRVKVQGPCAPGVIPGMFGRLEIPMGAREALVVPALAVMRVGQLDMVLGAEKGFVRRQFVRVGRRIVDAQARQMVEVLSGLEPGQPCRIVAEPSAFWARVGR